MTSKISKTNPDMAFFNARLDEIRMSGHERLKAKAHLARAEAFASAFAALIGMIKRTLKGSGTRSHRRTAPSAG